MEGLAMYSSDEERDDPKSKYGAERVKNKSSSSSHGGSRKDAVSMRDKRDSSSMSPAPPTSASGAAAVSSSAANVGSSHKYENHPHGKDKYNKNSSSSSHYRKHDHNPEEADWDEGEHHDNINKKDDNRRERSSHKDAQRERKSDQRDRDAKDHHHNKDYRERDHTDDARADYKNDRNRSRDFKNDYKRSGDKYRDDKRWQRDDHRRSQREREDDRGGSFKANRYSNSSSSSHNKDRYNYDARGSRHNDSASSSTSSRYRSKDDRPNYRRERSNERNRSSRNTNSRSRSRSRDLDRSAIEKARMSAQQVERKLTPEPTEDEGASSSSSARKLPQARNFEALLSLPLADNAPKKPSIIAVAPIASNSAEPAVIQLPSYYNPSVINPNKYAEQVQKRKLIWGAKKVEDTGGKWAAAQFSQDSDGKVASKFMRLMGMKGAAPEKAVAATPAAAVPDAKSREAMFTSMEQQYEVARQVTHTMRGVGLGFSSRPV